MKSKDGKKKLLGFWPTRMRRKTEITIYRERLSKQRMAKSHPDRQKRKDCCIYSLSITQSASHYPF